MNSFRLMKTGRGIAVALLVTGLVVAGLPRAALAQLPTPTPAPTVDPAFATPEPAAAAQPPFVPGELLVGVRQGAAGGGADANAAAAVTTADALTAAAAVAGAQVGDVIDTTGPDDDQVTYLLQMEPGQEYAVANELLGKPGVVYVEPNWYVTAAQEPVDPAPAAVDAHNAVDVSVGFAVNDPLYADNQWNLQRINAVRAWQMVYGQKLFPAAAPMTIAVLDSGMDTTHPEFAGRLLPGYNYIGSGNPTMRDGCGHGTHVAGIAAAGMNDSVGVAGVAPKVKVAPYRVLDDLCSGDIAIVAAGIISATVAGAQIINLSLETTQASTTLQNAVKYAAAQGVLVIAAAGNNKPGVSYPASYPEVVAVAALDYNDQRASYSNFGPQVEISAPGGDSATHKVLSAWPTDALGRCTAPVYSSGAAYCTRSGTSQATPAVAGAAALLWSLQPSLTAADVRAILRDTADPLAEAAPYVGAGKLNVANALRRILTSTINIVPNAVVTKIDASSLPLTLTMELQNPSLEAIDWSAALNAPIDAAVTATVTQGAWITMTSGVSNTQVGTVTYGEPAFVTLLISPTQAVSGTYSADLSVLGTRSDGAKVAKTLPIQIFLEVDPADPGTPVAPVTPVAPGTPVAPVAPLAPGTPVAPTLRLTYVPLVYGGSAPTDTIAAGSLEWLAPVTETERITYTLTNTSSVDASLPAGTKVGAKGFSVARIFADGFVALGNSFAELAPLPSLATGENRCIPSLAYPAQGVFGWWADLDPGTTGARVSSFTASDGRFVVEYEDVPAVGVMQPYTVSFQIVLGNNGDVYLNYAHTPRFIGSPERVTVGIEGQDALFYSLFGCATATTILGALPRSGESYLIQAKDIF